MASLTALGLMSGTSLDGIDVALIETDGERIARFGPVGYRPYAKGERDLLRRALAEATGLTDRAARPGVLAEAEALVTQAHADAVEDFLRTHGIERNDIAVVGFHGQTVLHRPEQRLTVQIGDGAALARRIGIPVVFDLRAADVAAGGQGAPLVPVFHRALIQNLQRPHPVAVLNIGGVANVSYIDGADLIACDTGPGNALIDDFMLAKTGAPYDRDGAAAARGRVDEAWLSAALAYPYFAMPPPKSLDRNAFASLDASGFSFEDGAATLTTFTAAAVAAVVPLLPRPPRSWIIAGGGARNPTMMRMLGERLAPARTETAQILGWSSDAIEAQAFAFLAVRSFRSLPITFPGTTGAPRPMTGGVIAGIGDQRSGTKPDT
ncbi:MAG: anhydro-N-acetylmuramic acid kinase [Hyphomicrobiales bacterium]|nr:anhydro-N-acetylmuramic acid kinase [Hyphomicrobiales bacterium]MBV9426829.1 anhydro-N-acetylmuramic acid kinase [Bradyrhizobiaceae bacterium]